MEDYRKFLSPRTLSKLEGLHLRARKIVEGFASGMHRSPMHGFSIEFAEHREYSPGDDLRYVDWKAFGRSDKFYLKRFEEETNLICYLALDVSRSMEYRGERSPLSKLEYAQCCAAAISYLAVRQRDYAGLTTFDDAIRRQIRPGSTASHWNDLLGVMDERESRPKTNVGATLHDLATRLGKRGLVILLGDLFDDVDAIVNGLKHLRHRRHDVIVMHTLDPDEIDFPFRRATCFAGLEIDERIVADPAAIRKAYLAEFGDYLTRIERGCRELGVDYVRLPTHRPLDGALAQFLARRAATV